MGLGDGKQSLCSARNQQATAIFFSSTIHQPSNSQQYFFHIKSALAINHSHPNKENAII